MSLVGYYTLNFQLIQHHKYSLTEIESMIPWEKEIYVSQLINYIQTENEKIRDRMAQRDMKRGMR